MARTAVLAALFGVVLLICPSTGSAEPPPNDDFADATEITGLPAEFTASNVGATREPDEPTSGDHSIWFSWTAPATGGVAIFTYCAPPFQDTGSSSPSVYVGSPVFGLVSAGLGSNFRAVAGREYWIAVTSSPGQPDPDVCLRLVPGPANDEFAAATRLTGFPVAATYVTPTEVGREQGPSTTEPGEPNHGGIVDPTSSPPGTVWYSWTAPADRRVVLRVCGGFGFGAVAVYTGDRIDDLTWMLTRRAREGSCSATATFAAVEGETYRLAVTGPSNFQLLIGTQIAVLPEPAPRFFYAGFPGEADRLKLRLTGAGLERALLVEAAGVTVANGCHEDTAVGNLRCPIPGRAGVALDIELRDANDTADVRLPGPVPASPDDSTPIRRVLGGEGDDKLAGSAGARRQDGTWVGALSLLGEGGADRISGGSGSEFITGGPGGDWIDPGAGSDSVSGGADADHIQSVDGASDRVRCDAHRDGARLDGVDLSRGCERRRLSSAARAVPTSAVLDNDDAESEDHLEITLACPIDARRGCATRIVAAVQPRRPITRRLRLRAGRSGKVTMYRFDYRVLRRGVSVTAITRRHGATLQFTRRLGVYDNRYFGE